MLTKLQNMAGEIPLKPVSYTVSGIFGAVRLATQAVLVVAGAVFALLAIAASLPQHATDKISDVVL